MAVADLDSSTNPPSIIVHTNWNEKELIQDIPGSSYRNNCWHVPLTWAACLQLRGTFQERLQIGEALSAWAFERRQAYVEPALRLREQLTTEQHEEDWLYPFQRVAVDMMSIVNYGLIGDDMGIGKSAETIGYVQNLKDDAYPVLIIAPNSVKAHWATRITNWLPSTTPYVLEGTQRNKYDALAVAALDERAVIITNYESMRSLAKLAPFGNVRLKRCRECDRYAGDDSLTPATCQVHAKPLNIFGFRTVILDEAHRIKDPNSQQTRACWSVCHEPSVKYAWALTGTPIANHIGDLWAIMHAVAPDEYPTKSKFIDRYCVTDFGTFGGLTVSGLRPDKEQEFRQFFNPRFRRVTKDMVLPQLPSKVHTVRTVEMSRTQARMYAELEESLMCRTETGELLISKSQLSAQIRLSQLSCSSVKITNKLDARDPASWTVELKMPSPKIEELVSVAAELGSRQAVVAAEHSKLIDLACIRLSEERIPHLKITGDVSPHDRQRALDALNAGVIQLLLFTTKAGGVGLDMSAASCLIWLQHPWSMVEYLQTEDRVRRIGSERHEQIDIVHIITQGTIEEDKIRRLQQKLARLDEVNQDRARMMSLGQSVDSLDLDSEAETLMSSFLGSR